MIRVNDVNLVGYKATGVRHPVRISLPIMVIDQNNVMKLNDKVEKFNGTCFVL